ncbi:MAG TPA: hypothetical protein VFX25_09545 [Streptosporangiaceae bacterium]|nr:hypothetical protein [Streptosporangiaceae bacterium]
MTDKPSSEPEIESFNLEELDVSGLDARLELTTLMPQIFPVCHIDCEGDFVCHTIG